MTARDRIGKSNGAADLLEEIDTDLKRIFPVQGPRFRRRDQHLASWIEVLPNEPATSVAGAVDYARRRRAKQLLELRSDRPRPSDPAGFIAFDPSDERRDVLIRAVREVFATFMEARQDTDLQRLCIMRSLSVAIGLVYRVPLPPVEKGQLIQMLTALAVWLESANKGSTVRQLERRRNPKKRPEDGPAKTQFRGLCVNECRRLVGKGSTVLEAAQLVYKQAKAPAKKLGIRGKRDEFTSTTIRNWYARDRAKRNGWAGEEGLVDSLAVTLAMVLDGVFGENSELTFAQQLNDLIERAKSYPRRRALS